MHLKIMNKKVERFLAFSLILGAALLLLLLIIRENL